MLNIHFHSKSEKTFKSWHTVAQSGTLWHTFLRYNMPAQNRKRGDSFGVDPKNREKTENALVKSAINGTLSRKLKKYLKECRISPSPESKKEVGRLPTLAGFCAALGCGTTAAIQLQQLFPDCYDYICAVLEDEALNSPRSPALINAYLKERFNYGEKSVIAPTCNVIQPIFEHDILEDGA